MYQEVSFIPYSYNPVKGQEFTIYMPSITGTCATSFMISKDGGAFLRATNQADRTMGTAGLNNPVGFAQNSFISQTFTASEMDADDILVLYNNSYSPLYEPLPDMTTFTITADSEEGSNVANNIVDDTDSYWETTLDTGSQSGSAWIKIQIDGFDFDNIYILFKDADSAMTGFLVQTSTNDTDWTTQETIDDSTIKTYHKGDVWFPITTADTNDANYIRILADSETGVDKWAIKEIYFTGYKSGTYSPWTHIKTVPSELATCPTTASTLEEKITALYQYFFLRRDMTNYAMTMYKDDALTSLCSATISDDGLTVSKGEIS